MRKARAPSPRIAANCKNLLTYCRLNKGRVHFVVVFNLTRFARDKYDHFALRSLLYTRTFCTCEAEFSSLQRTVSLRRTAANLFENLSCVRGRPMIVAMTTTGRHQRRYGHRLQDLVQRTGDVTIAT